MPYQPREVVPSAARTTSADSGAINAGGSVRFQPIDSVSLLVDVTAVSGTGPTLDLSVEWSHDGTTWAPAEPADDFTQITAVGSVVKNFSLKMPIYRVVWTIAGTTPSFTFSIVENVDADY